MKLPSFQRLKQRLYVKKGFARSAFVHLARYTGRIAALWIIASGAMLANANTAHQLRIDAAAHLKNTYSHPDNTKLDIRVNQLDARTRVQPCKSPLRYKTQDPVGNGGNINVQVICESPRWALYIPAQVGVFRNVPVAAKDIGRGEQLSASHLTNAEVNISAIRQVYLGDASVIVGKEAKRVISRGDVIRESALDAPTLVHRGDQVIVESNVGGIRVSSAGTALADGRLGQKIRVKNNSSSRTVSARVVASGRVETF